jgi:hypothetical protein
MRQFRRSLPLDLDVVTPDFSANHQQHAISLLQAGLRYDINQSP